MRIALMYCASVKTLTSIKDVTPEIAKAVRKVWLEETTSRREKREAIDRLIETSGVEFLGRHKRSKLDVYYCNAGDTYAGTILFVGNRLTVGCCGDMVEANLIREETPLY